MGGGEREGVRERESDKEREREGGRLLGLAEKRTKISEDI